MTGTKSFFTSKSIFVTLPLANRAVSTHAYYMNSASSPYRVIAVCTGNICRSPMAELMLAAALQREGLDSLVTIDSAGTTGYEAGRPIDPRAARRLSATQIVSDRHAAREWQPVWFRERDLILALDIDHYAWLTESAP